MNRFFYKSEIKKFVKDSIETIFGIISMNDAGDSVKEQKYAWSEEIEIMQHVLFPWREENAEIILATNNFILKKIEPDGNCFFRALSYFYRNTEEDYKEFRELIARYIQNNADEYMYAVADADINITKSDDEMRIFLKCNIKMYILNDNGYKLIFEFNNKPNNENENQNIDIINILFINNNHFNLLIKRQESHIIRNNLLERKMDIKDIEKILNIKSNQTNVKIKEKFKLDLKKKTHVNYPKKGLNNYYNEIYEYIKNNNCNRKLETVWEIVTDRISIFKKRKQISKTMENNLKIKKIKVDIHFQKMEI